MIGVSTSLPELIHSPASEVPEWAVVAHPRPYLCTLTPDGATASRAVPHVNNIEYLRWVDRAAELHARAIGMSRESLLEQGQMWFVARHELDYEAEAWPGDALVVATWVRNVGKARSWRDTVVWRPRDRTVVLRAATSWVLVDILSRKPARLTDEVALQLDPLEPRDLAGRSIP
ncbi:MAG: acyl-CoA thioesterase [Phycisphaeraceae bacterium]|nr:acyl-CoA thioesterase [Phycisphaeraceae bacterium]